MTPKIFYAPATGLALAAMATAALAQSSTSINFSPIIDTLAPLLMTVLTALATWIGWYVKNLVASKVDLSNTQLDEQLQQMYNEAASRSIAYAETALKGVVPKHADVKNEFVATAAEYLLKFWPDLVEKVGLTPEKVKATILARLPAGAMTTKADDIVLAKAAGQAPVPETK